MSSPLVTKLSQLRSLVLSAGLAVNSLRQSEPVKTALANLHQASHWLTIYTNEAFDGWQIVKHDNKPNLAATEQIRSTVVNLVDDADRLCLMFPQDRNYQFHITEVKRLLVHAQINLAIEIDLIKMEAMSAAAKPKPAAKPKAEPKKVTTDGAKATQKPSKSTKTVSKPKATKSKAKA